MLLKLWLLSISDYALSLWIWGMGKNIDIMNVGFWWSRTRNVANDSPLIFLDGRSLLSKKKKISSSTWCQSPYASGTENQGPLQFGTNRECFILHPIVDFRADHTAHSTVFIRLILAESNEWPWAGAAWHVEFNSSYYLRPVIREIGILIGGKAAMIIKFHPIAGMNVYEVDGSMPLSTFYLWLFRFWLDHSWVGYYEAFFTFLVITPRTM